MWTLCGIADKTPTICYLKFSLSKNGYRLYVTLYNDVCKEYGNMIAWRKLKADLDEGRHSGEQNSWLSSDEVKAHLQERYTSVLEEEPESLD